MAGLVVMGILVLIFVAVMVRSYLIGKKIGTYPKGGLLGRTKGYSSPAVTEGYKSADMGEK
jgi:hypothetical protein